MQKAQQSVSFSWCLNFGDVAEHFWLFAFVAGPEQEAALCSLSGSTCLSMLQFVALRIRAVGVVLPYGALLKMLVAGQVCGTGLDTAGGAGAGDPVAVPVGCCREGPCRPLCWANSELGAGGVGDFWLAPGCLRARTRCLALRQALGSAARVNGTCAGHLYGAFGKGERARLLDGASRCSRCRKTQRS